MPGSERHVATRAAVDAGAAASLDANVVPARSRVHRVARTGADPVRALAAVHAVLAAAAVQPIAPGAALEAVVPAAALDAIGAAPSQDPVARARSLQVVRPAVAADQVRAGVVMATATTTAAGVRIDVGSGAHVARLVDPPDGHEALVSREVNRLPLAGS